MDEDLQLKLLRRIVERLEAKAPASGVQTGDEVELREMLLALEISIKFKARTAPPAKAGVDWSKHLPLLLVLAVILAAVVASALGLDVRGLL